MEDLFMSDFIRSYYKKIGFTFSDKQKAAIIYNCDEYSRAEKLQKLQKLFDSTSDTELKKQIEERLCYEKLAAEKFFENSGDYVYVVIDNDGCSIGYFQKAETAIKYGISAMEEDNIEIEKQLIVKCDEIPVVASGARVLFKISQEEEYEGIPDSNIKINSNGEITFLWSKELPQYEIDNFDINRFENMFIPFPYPNGFDRGVKVKDISLNKTGFIVTTKQEWESVCNKAERGFHLDYSDATIIVNFEWDNDIIHGHVNVLELELAD